MSTPQVNSNGSRLPAVMRWVLHGTLLLAFAAAGGAVLVWPQWVAADGARAALEAQREQEQDLGDQLAAARNNLQVGRLWQQDHRRVFLRSELGRYPSLVSILAKQDGCLASKVQVTGQSTLRFRPLAVGASVLTDESGALDGMEIAPRQVRVFLSGKFDSIYRTVGSLCQQQQLFIPERWDMVPQGAAGILRAEIWATVFVVREPAAGTHVPAGSGPVAAAAEAGGQG